jgi:hypothetical protein
MAVRELENQPRARFEVNLALARVRRMDIAKRLEDASQALRAAMGRRPDQGDLERALAEVEATLRELIAALYAEASPPQPPRREFWK